MSQCSTLQTSSLWLVPLQDSQSLDQSLVEFLILLLSDAIFTWQVPNMGGISLIQWIFFSNQPERKELLTHSFRKNDGFVRNAI